MNFYPRSPCGERRPTKTCGCRMTIFLSTLSLRRATSKRSEPSSCRLFLSTLSLRRATRKTRASIHHAGISIHALLAESDRISIVSYKSIPRRFLSTLSLRRATNSGAAAPAPGAISIHALLAESDLSYVTNVFMLI